MAFDYTNFLEVDATVETDFQFTDRAGNVDSGLQARNTVGQWCLETTGSTASGGTGPTANPVGRSAYVYNEATTPVASTTWAMKRKTSFNTNSESLVIEFLHNTNADTNSEYYVEYATVASPNETTDWTIFHTVQGNNTDAWVQQSHDFSTAPASSTFWVRIRLNTANDFTNDFAFSTWREIGTDIVLDTAFPPTIPLSYNVLNATACTIYSAKAQAFFDRVIADGGTLENKDWIASQIDNFNGKETLSFIAGAYKVGKIYSPFPEDGSGDLDVFNRSTVSYRITDAGKLEEIALNTPTVSRITEIPQRTALFLESQETNELTVSEPTSTQSSDSNVTFESHTWDTGLFTNCVSFGDNSLQRNIFYSFSGVATEFIRFSCFVEMEDGTAPVLGTDNISGDFSIIIENSIASGHVRVERISTASNVWRVSATRQLDASSTLCGVEKYVGQSSKSFKVTGFQLFYTTGTSIRTLPKSYIKTTGSTNNRARIISNITNVDGIQWIGLDSKGFYSSSQGTLLMDAFIDASSGTNVQLRDSAGEVLSWYYNSVRAILTDGVNSDINNSLGSFSDFKGWIKIAVSWDSTSTKYYINGTSRYEAPNSIFNPINASELRFGLSSAGSDFQGLYNVTLYNEALSSSEMESLTTVTVEESSETTAYIDRVTTDGGVIEGVRNLEEKLSSLNGSETFVLIPSGYKTSKIYAQVPTNGNGDITLSRTSTGTRVNQAGELEVEAINVPRITFEDGTPTLLVYSDRENEIPRSEEFLLSDWSYNNTGNSFVNNSIISPDGRANGCLFTQGGTSGCLAFGGSHTVNDVIVISGFFKEGNVPRVRLGGHFANESSVFDINAGTVISDSANVVSSGIEDHGNGWYRCWVQYTFQDQISNGLLYTGFKALTSGDVSQAGNTVYSWGMQIEDDNLSHYTKTSGTPHPSETRDTLTDLSDATLINSPEGVIYLEGSFPTDSVNKNIILDDGTSTNRITFNIVNRGISVTVSSGGVTQASLSVTNLDVYQNHKYAFRWKANEFALFVDGVLEGSDTSGSTYSASTLTDIDFGNSFYSSIRDLRLMGAGWTDSDLELLTLNSQASVVVSNLSNPLTLSCLEVTVNADSSGNATANISTLPLTYTAEIAVAEVDSDANALPDTLSLNFEIPPFLAGAPIVVSNQIAPGNNNAEETIATTVMDMGSSDIELGGESGGLQQSGFRFINLLIPPGSIISKAYIQFTADETDSTTLSLKIEGQAEDNPLIFQDINGNISTRPRTTANVTWDPPFWDVVQRRSAAEQTSDISSIIQEIVNRPTYSQTDAIVIIFESLTGGTASRAAESSNGTAADAAEIFVEYYNSSVDVTVDGVLNSSFSAPLAAVSLGELNEALAEISFLTWNAPEVKTVLNKKFLFLSDAGDAGHTNHVTIANAIIARNPDRVIHGGDTYPTGTPASALSGYAAFQSLIDAQKFTHIQGDHCLEAQTVIGDLTLGTNIFGTTDTWTYLNLPNGNAFPTDWKLLGFDETGWSTAAGSFGYGTITGKTVGTTLTSSLQNYLFRKVVNSSSITNNGLVIELSIDDACEIYVNGERIYSVNMEYPITITSGSLGTAEASAPFSNVFAEGFNQVIRIPSSIFQSGDNQIAVLLKNEETTSSDVYFEMALHNYTFPSVGVFGSMPFYSNGFGDGLRSIIPYEPPYFENYSLVNGDVEWFFITTGVDNNDIYANPAGWGGNSLTADWLSNALRSSEAIIKIVVTHETMVTMVSGKYRTYLDWLLDSLRFPFDALVHGDVHVSSAITRNTGLKVLDASNYPDPRSSSGFVQALQPSEWTNEFFDGTSGNNLYLDFKNLGGSVEVDFVDASGTVPYQTEILPISYIPPTLSLGWSALDATVSTTGSANLVVQDSVHSHSVGNVVLVEGEVLTLQEVSHPHNVENVSLTQKHLLQVQESNHTHSTESIALVEGEVLTVQESSHTTLSDNLDVVQSNLLVVQSSDHNHSSEAPSLTQGLSLVVQESLHSHDSENIILIEGEILTVQDSTHFQNTDNLELTQKSNLVLESSEHSHLVDSVNLVEGEILTLEGSSHQHATEGAILTQKHVLQVSEVNHSLVSDNVSLAQSVQLSVQESSHDHSSENISLVEGEVLVVQESNHTHFVENIELSQEHLLDVQETVHSVVSENLTLSGGSFLSIDSSNHVHSSEEATLVQGNFISVQESLHSHSAEDVVVTESSNLTVQDSIHSTSVNNVTLTEGEVLIVQSSLHSHSSEEVNLSSSGSLDVQDSTHSHNVDSATLTEEELLSLQSTLHSQAVESVSLTQKQIIVIQDSTHNHLVDTVPLAVSKILDIQDTDHQLSSDNLNLVEGEVILVDSSSISLTSENIGLTQKSTLACQESGHVLYSDDVIFLAYKFITVLAKFSTGSSVNIKIYDLDDDSLLVDTFMSEIPTLGYFKYKFGGLVNSANEFLYIMSDGTNEQSGKFLFREGDIVGEMEPIASGGLGNADWTPVEKAYILATLAETRGWSEIAASNTEGLVSGIDWTPEERASILSGIEESKGWSRIAARNTES